MYMQNSEVIFVCIYSQNCFVEISIQSPELIQKEYSATTITYILARAFG